MKKLISILLAAALLLTLASCGKQQGDSSMEGDFSGEGSSSIEEEAPEEVSQQPQREAKPFGVGYYKGYGINPYTCTNAQNQTITGLVYEPLFEVDNHFEAKPCLAEDITVKVSKQTVQQEVKKKETKKNDKDKTEEATTSAAEGDSSQEAEDQKKPEEKPEMKTITVYTTTVTLTVRKDVAFSDGSGLHADDVAYSLEQAAASESIYHSRLAHISKISTSGRQTVTFTMDVGQSDVAALLSVPIVKSGTGGELFPIGTGPYVPQIKKGTFQKLTANKTWWRQGQEEVVLSETDEEGEELVSITKKIERPVKKIKVSTYEDSDDLIFGFGSSQVTALNMDFTGTEALYFPGDFSVTDYPTSTLIYLGCNTKKGTVCSDESLRSTLYRCLDRTILADRMMARHAIASALPVSPKSRWYNEELAEKWSYDVDVAKKLCKKLGDVGTIRLMVNTESAFKTALAEEIKKELETAGFHVEVEQLNWKSFKKALKKGNYDLYLGEVKLDSTFDLSRLVLEGGSMNYAGYSDQKLTDALKAFSAAEDKKKEVNGKKVNLKAEAAKTYFKLLYQKAPIIPVCFKNGSALTIDENVTAPLSTQQNLYAQLWRWKIDSEVVKASK
ncbi:MAG: ABC transporter substrate-binding protein [Oscillospiraceae bacterium]|nr:ABC transporter substrate-binding protein [Oscillospiraceae bacterium]